MTLVLPWNLPPSRSVFSPVNTSRSGGTSLSGSEHVVQSNAGHWGCRLEIPVYHEERVLAYRALMAGLEGRGVDILVPCLTKYRPRNMDGRMQGMASAAPFALSELSGFGQTEPEIMWTAQPADLGGQEMVISHPHQPPLRPGHYFGIGQRLHLISAAWSIENERLAMNGGTLTYGADALTYGGEALTYGTASAVFEGHNLQAIRFWPRLREPVQVGAPLILGRPVCKMRLAADDSGTLDLDYGLYGQASLEFREVY